MTAPDGGTALCLIRDDKFSVDAGEPLLEPHLLDPASSTQRLVATCCNSAMFLSFKDGRFWKSVMVDRIVSQKPAIEMRLCTKYRTSGLPWPDDAPRYRKFPVSALARIGQQWLSMKLGH